MCAMCEGQSVEDYVADVEGLIQRYGWALQYVSSVATVDDRTTEFWDTDWSGRGYDGGEIVPAFCYTVGLTDHGLPEIVVTGRSAGESASLLNSLARRILVEGRRFEAGSECDAAGLSLSFVDVVECRDWLVMATRIYGHSRVDAVQAVWRDDHGELPWEGAYPSTIVQPVLGPPPGWGEADQW